MKSALLHDELWSALQQDAGLYGVYEQEMTDAATEAGGYGLKAHLRLQRRLNLTGLLQRLDTSTMLASVEGRTPFADSVVTRLAESLPMDLKFRMDGDRIETKRVLRESFRATLPEEVIAREKASFPLPFQDWVSDQTERLRSSAFAREMFTEAGIASVCSDPQALLAPVVADDEHRDVGRPLVRLIGESDRSIRSPFPRTQSASCRGLDRPLARPRATLACTCVSGSR